MAVIYYEKKPANKFNIRQQWLLHFQHNSYLPVPLTIPLSPHSTHVVLHNNP